MDHAGFLVARVAERLQQETLPACAELAAALAGVVDMDFKAHCRVAGLRSGKLLLMVDHPARLAPLRLRWLCRLQEIMSRKSRGRRVAGVVFELGNAGVRIGDVETERVPGATCHPPLHRSEL